MVESIKETLVPKASKWRVVLVRENDVEVIHNVNLKDLRTTVKKGRELGDEKSASLVDCWLYDYILDELIAKTPVNSNIKRVTIEPLN